MALADPWDEIARLEKQMDVEIRAQLDDGAVVARRALVRADEEPLDELSSDL